MSSCSLCCLTCDQVFFWGGGGGGGDKLLRHSLIPHSVNPLHPKSVLIDFTLSNARRFDSSKRADTLGLKVSVYPKFDHFSKKN